MSKKVLKQDGFTLIELMIVVVIIGILAAIAIPKFSNVSKGAKESEAGSVLKQIHTLQDTYKMKNDTYATAIPVNALAPAAGELEGWEDPNAKYYTFAIVSASATGYCAQANLTPEGTDAGLQQFHVAVAGAATDGKPQPGAC